ncbi:hypothetical protein HPP92_009458 [Vanilla planifolia]|uniref:HhH-GPD domain-containing protein n=1 Tax=Vanilla planifolia TaxID=51239 RepID=A0A835RBK1_VANPL|nr:hypothetical protein HPP92_009458 [Vanilla planifolia]
MSAAATSSTAKKIPFRSRKVRISSSEPPSTDTSKKPRLVLPILPRSLSAPGELDSALGHLRAVDPTIAHLINSHDPPAFDNSATPFLFLSRSILYQQLATKAAASIYARFLSLCGGEDSVLPEIVSALTPQQLREIGVSARKASYLHDLSSKYLSGVLTDPAIVAMDDESLLSLLTLVKGIGPWSVHMYLLERSWRYEALRADTPISRSCSG